METLITSVTLVKANGRQSEQTFSVGVTVSPCSVNNLLRVAQIRNENFLTSYDYHLNTTDGEAYNFVSVVFPPSEQTLTFPFFLNADSIPEDEECFKAVATAVNLNTYPSFQVPYSHTTTAFQTTSILIEDNDGI